MKQTRRLAMLALMLALITTLTSCIMIPMSKYYDEFSPETTISVEIYDLRNSETGMGSAFLDTETPIYAVPEEKKADFLKDLAQIHFTDYIIITVAAIDPSFYYGDWVVRVNLTDGSYVLISDGGYGETFDENDQMTESNHYSCEDEDWDKLIEMYVPESIRKSSNQNVEAVTRG